MKKPRLLISWLIKERKSVSSIYLLALLQGILYILIPLSIQGVITYLMAGRFSASLILLSALTVIATLLIGVSQLWQMRITETLHEKIFGELVSKLTALFRGGLPTGIRYKINHFFEVISLQKGMAKILLDFSFSVISIFFGLLILPAYSTWFLVFTVLVSAVFYMVVHYYGKISLDNSLAVSNRKYQIFDWFRTQADNRAAAEDTTTQAEILLDEYFTRRKAYYHILEKQFRWILGFKILFVSILLFIGAYLVEIGELNIGQFVASEIIILMVINAVEKLITNMSTFYDVIVSLYKIEDILAGQKDLSFLKENNRAHLKSMKNMYLHPYARKTKRLLLTIMAIGVIVLFMPWTQNVEVSGYITALNPGNKPQAITSRIAGRIEKWFISDGDFVKANDTIAFISEIKDDYIDPQLIMRSQEQIRSKETSLESYSNKINSINLQIDALNSTLNLKTEQLRNKIRQLRLKLQSDSTESVTAANNYTIAEAQLARYEDLLQKGVISKTDAENRKVKLQDAQAKAFSAKNKVEQTRNELINTEIELNAVRQEYNEKLMKAESDKFSALSLMYEGQATLAKMQNQLANYAMRQSFYYVLAPQDGYVRNITVKGIGEIIKEGGVLCDIVPTMNEQAVELFVNPVDLPLINTGQQVQIMFDGWPVFVFSGWPGISYGTYTAEVIAIDRTISSNGKFRILARSKSGKWPQGVHIGGGVKGYALLKDVPLVYELWRKINGFPPEFYQPQEKDITYEKQK